MKLRKTGIRASEVDSIRSGRNKQLSFGKAWNPGDQLHLFIRLQEFNEEDPVTAVNVKTYEPIIATEYGFRVVDKALGDRLSYFIPSLVERIDFQPVAKVKDEEGNYLLDEDGDLVWEPTSEDILGRFTKYSRLVHKALYEKRITELDREYADQPALYNTALHRANLDFGLNLKKSERQMRDSKTSIDPMMSGPTLYAATEVYSIVTENNLPKKDGTRGIFTFDWSGSRPKAILAMLKSEGNVQYIDNIPFLEVVMTFGSDNDRAKAGKDASILNTQEVDRIANKVPEFFETIKDEILSLPESEQVIRKRNWNFQSKSEKEIRNALRETVRLDAPKLSYLTDEDDLEAVSRSAADLVGVMDLSDITRGVFGEAIQSILKEIEEKKREAEVVVSERTNDAPKKAPTIEELANSASVEEL